MIQVRCEGCQASFELDEKRLPKTGMRVRCPKCGSTFHVTPEGKTSALQPAGAKPPAGPPKAPPPPPRPMAGNSFDDLPSPAVVKSDLPAVAKPAAAPKPSLDADLPAPARAGGGADLPVPARAGGGADLPVPARVGAKPGVTDLPVARASAPGARGPGVQARPMGASPAAPPPPSPLPPPPPPSAPMADFGDLDLPAPAAGRADLPAPVKGKADLPAPVRARPQPSAPAASAPAPSAPRGALDLHALDDLPVAAAPNAGPSNVATDDLDDPFSSRGNLGRPRAPEPQSLADLPAAKNVDADFSDLPAPAAASADLPSVPGSGTDLPARPGEVRTGKQLGRVTLSRRAVAVDEAGLPTAVAPAALPAVPASLPVAAPTGSRGVQGAALPATSPARGAAASFGELDLEMKAPSVPPAEGASDPFEMKAPSLPPLPGGDGSGGDEFGDLAMRAPSLAPPAAGGASDFDLGGGMDLAPPSAPSLPPPPDLDLPMPPPPAGDSLKPPTRATGAAPAGPSAARGAPTPPPVQRTARGGTGFGEISLGDEEVAPPTAPSPAGGDDEEFDQIPQEDQPRRAAPAVPMDSIETAIPPRETTGDKAPAKETRREKPAAEGAKTPSRAGLYVGLGLIGAVVIGGAALSLTPAGPFGTTWLDEKLHGAERHAAAAHAIDAVRVAMDHDTFAGVKRALRALDTQIQRTPSEQQLLAYGTYAYFTALARFGNDSSMASRARVLYDRLAPLPPSTQYLNAARLARDLVQGRLDAVRRASETDPVTRDLHTMAMLDGDDPAAALEAATRANDRAHTARTRFLLARALYLADDRAGAIREAEGVLESEHDHAGARLLLSRLLSDRAETRDRAVSLAGEVEAMGQSASSDERTEAAVMVGETELARDHISQARQAFERALELDPRSPQALNGIATILYRDSNFTESLARFQAAHSADPSDIDATIGIAMASISLNQPADARSTLEPLVPTHPTDPRVHFWLARALLAVNEQTAAEREFREAIRLDNGNLEAYTTLASMLFANQRPDAAEAVLEEARTHVSDQASIHRALGEGRAARGDLNGALGEFEAAVRARPDDVRSHFLFAQTLRRLGRYDTATQQLEEVARIDAQYPGLLVERGQLAEARGDAQGALTTFRAALSHDPGNPLLIVRVIAALNANGQFAEAESQGRQLLAEHTNIAEAHFVRGRALLGLGNFEQAVQEFNRAIELDATRADFRAYAAEANLGLAQYGAALEQASRAITLDPNYARGYWVRGEVRVRSGAAVQGLLDAQQALRLDAHFAPALATLADADEALGHVPEAITVYRQAIAMEPNRGEWHARMGRLLADSGHPSEAVQELNRATSLGDPVSPPPAWLAQAHRQLGDLLSESDRAGARRHFQRFLDLTPPNASGYNDVRRAMAELGGR